MQKPQTGHTVQNGRIIEMLSSAQPMYFSEKLGRDFGQPTGGWTAERDQATVMTEQKATQLVEGPLALSGQFCKVVEAS